MPLLSHDNSLEDVTPAGTALEHLDQSVQAARPRGRRRRRYNEKEITLRWLEEYAPQGILTTDRNLCVRSWNRWLELRSGRTAAAAYGKHLFELFPDLVTRELDRFYTQALTGQVNFVSQRLHGYVLPLSPTWSNSPDAHMQQSARIAPLLADNEIVGTITIIDDVTDRVAREAELQHKIASLEALHEIGHAILSLDLSDCLQRIVLVAATLMQASTAAVILRHGDELRIDASVGVVGDDFAVSLSDEHGVARVVTHTGQVVRLDDAHQHPYHQRTAIKPLVAASRSVIGVPLTVEGKVIGALVVETPQIKAFSADRETQVVHLATQAAVAIKNAKLYDGLRAREQELTEFFENAVVGIRWTNADGEIEHANRAESELLGYRRDELVGQHFSKFFAAPAVAYELLERLRQGEIITNLEVQTVHKDGSARFALIDASGEMAGGVFKRARFFSRDISDRKLAEDRLQRSENLLHHSQKMEAVGRLASGVAHDFNNLLTAIIGYSQLVLRKLSPDDPTHSIINEIVKAGERSASLTAQLLTFSRKQHIEPKVVDLNSAVRDTHKLLRRLIGEDIALNLELAENLPFTRADVGQLCQVIMNLAVNSRDAMPDGGTLSLTTTAVTFSDELAAKSAGLEPGAYLLLKVSDTGCGISKDLHSQIFEPFFTTKEDKGTGLGLATVYGIVRQNNGNITLESDTGLGATFFVYFPVVDSEVDEPRAASNRDFPLHGDGTILLAEDEDFVRRLAVRVLRDKGYRVLEARDGDEALRIAAEYGVDKIDLLFTDIVMPSVGGKSLARQLLEINPRMKVLYTSGYMDPHCVPNCELLPSDEFLRKPFYPLSLVQKVHHLLKP